MYTSGTYVITLIKHVFLSLPYNGLRLDLPGVGLLIGHFQWCDQG